MTERPRADMREEANYAERASVPQGPPRYPVSRDTQYRDANWQYLAAPPPKPPQKLGPCSPHTVGQPPVGRQRPVYVPIAAIAVGLMTSGFLTGVRQVGTEDGIDYDTLTPDPSLLYSGWFLLAFLLANATFSSRTDEFPAPRPIYTLETD